MNPVEHALCANCSCVKEVVVQERGIHLGMYCKVCGSWLGWIPHNRPYNPNWEIEYGKYKGTPISRLPTGYLLEQMETAKGDRKAWFTMAYRGRHVDFLNKIKIIIDDKPRTVSYVKDAFHALYPICETSFDQYLSTCLEMIVKQSIIYNSVLCLQNGKIWFSDQPF